MIIWASLFIIYRFLPLQLFSWSFTACALRLKSIWICEFYQLKYSRFSSGTYIYHLKFFNVMINTLFHQCYLIFFIVFPSRTLHFKRYLCFCAMLVAVQRTACRSPRESNSGCEVSWQMPLPSVYLAGPINISSKPF